MSQSQGIKGGSTDEAFQEQCFLRGAFVGLDFDFFFTFNIFYMHKHILNTLREGEKCKKLGLF